MKTNLAGYLQHEVKVPTRIPLLPVFEAISNSLDAISDATGRGKIHVTFERDLPDVEGHPGDPTSVKIEDSGPGFTDANFRSFNELYATQKLGRKGRGRFAYLKVFQRAEITSTHQRGSQFLSRKIQFDLDYDESKGKAKVSTETKTGTTVQLLGFKKSYSAHVPKSGEFVARDICCHFFPALITNRDIDIVVTDGQKMPLQAFIREKLRAKVDTQNVKVDGDDVTISHVRMKPTAGFEHTIAYCAHQREVASEAVSHLIPYIRNQPLIATDFPEGFIYYAIIQSASLDARSDPLRTRFDDSDDNHVDENADLLPKPAKISAIKRAVVEAVRAYLDPFATAIVQERAKAIDDYIRADGIGYHFLRADVEQIAKETRGIDAESLEDALHEAAQRERKLRKADVRAVLSATPEQAKEEPYRSKWLEIVDRISDAAKSELAAYIAHRRAIIDLVEDRTRKTEHGDVAREAILHAIIFPRFRQSGDVSEEQQNLWLIDERLTFHEHLYSDVSIKKITGGADQSELRPDIALFESGFASFHDGNDPPSQLVLVELKKPGRRDASKDDPVSKTLAYVSKLRAGGAVTEGDAPISVSKEALVTVYIIADWTTDFLEYLEREQFNDFPGDGAKYVYRKENILFFALSFDRLISQAKRRNRVFFKKLGIN